jgi:hypothetical protein
MESVEETELRYTESVAKEICRNYAEHSYEYDENIGRHIVTYGCQCLTMSIAEFITRTCQKHGCSWYLQSCEYPVVKFVIHPPPDVISLNKGL